MNSNESSSKRHCLSIPVDDRWLARTDPGLSGFTLLCLRIKSLLSERVKLDQIGYATFDRRLSNKVKARTVCGIIGRPANLTSRIARSFIPSSIASSRRKTKSRVRSLHSVASSQPFDSRLG